MKAPERKMTLLPLMYPSKSPEDVRVPIECIHEIAKTNIFYPKPVFGSIIKTRYRTFAKVLSKLHGIHYCNSLAGAANIPPPTYVLPRETASRNSG